MKLGFIGIGRMGQGMAPRLLEAGHSLAVHDVRREACAAVIDRGASWCDSPAQVVHHCDVLLSCLPGPAEVATVYEGPQGILSNAKPGLLLLEMSTISPQQSRHLAQQCQALGMRYLDAPISNGVEPAARGELTIMVGGERVDYEQALPILHCLGNRLYLLGPAGSGNIAKIGNQMIYLSYVAAFCETMRLAREAGMDVNAMIDVMRHSVSGTPLMTKWEQRLENGDRDGGFRIRRVLKDLELGEEACRELGLDTPVFDAVLRTYRNSAEKGQAEYDMTVIYSAGSAKA